ncbi:MAG TPA: phosphoenolpyruvate--protein phosphotransferase [Rhodothermales bacterium]|nr:phosphoenolpyruvate--protein phosphotransferase [Rhodothermales bacterium]
MSPEHTHERKPEHVVQGIGVSPGIAIGPAFLFERDHHDIERYEINPGEVDGEINRFESAVQKSERDLNKIASIAREKLGEASAAIFEAQALMLRDHALYDSVVEKIGKEHCNAAYAVASVLNQHRQNMLASDSEYFRERANDLLDVQERIVRHLRRGKILSAVDHDSIVVAETLTAADIILFSRRNILGCALDYSGSTSHVSIMARALNVPAIVGTHGISQSVESGDQLILDGLHGRVIVNPTPETLKRYRRRLDRFQHLVSEHKQIVPLPAETRDGHRITLRANLEFAEELPLLKEYGAQGIGLFRTEILFLMQGRLAFSEEDQLKTYRRIVENVAPETTTFRVLDLGGDKMLPLGHREQNPFLGWRGIRVLLDKPEILFPQVRAILRASTFGPIRILLPMVTQIWEVERFREALDQAKAELREEGQPFDEDVPVGIMVEVPSVALMIQRFAAAADFFSLGSNDLTQYTLAVDRGNDLVAHLYDELDPSVLLLIKQTAETAERHGLPVGICGEMAGSPRAAPLLVGLGLRDLSASPVFLPEVKRVIRSMKLDDAVCLADQALAAPDARAVGQLLDEWLREHAPDLALLLSGDPGTEENKQ